MYVVVVMLFFLRVVEYFCGGLSEIGLSFGSNFGPFFRVDHFFVLVACPLTEDEFMKMNVQTQPNKQTDRADQRVQNIDISINTNIKAHKHKSSNFRVHAEDIYVIHPPYFNP